MKQNFHVMPSDLMFRDRLRFVSVCRDPEGNLVFATPDNSLMLKVHMNEPDGCKVEYWCCTQDILDLAKLMIRFVADFDARDQATATTA